MGRPKLDQPYVTQYWAQKQNARRRGIEFDFTYADWISWWGNDIVSRGRGTDKLVMARKGDTGSYCADNVVKMINQDNVSQGNQNKIFSDDYRKKLSIASYKRWGTYKEEQILCL